MLFVQVLQVCWYKYILRTTFRSHRHLSQMAMYKSVLNYQESFAFNLFVRQLCLTRKPLSVLIPPDESNNFKTTQRS